uniref:Uncharacterized protein n=1 Tax=Lepeophtheirus salmonis TaxID=72036 RepID=A0A0K2UC52_LEPSM
MICITLHKKIYHIIFAIAVAQRSLDDHTTYFCPSPHASEPSYSKSKST